MKHRVLLLCWAVLPLAACGGSSSRMTPGPGAAGTGGSGTAGSAGMAGVSGSAGTGSAGTGSAGTSGGSGSAGTGAAGTGSAGTGVGTGGSGAGSTGSGAAGTFASGTAGSAGGAAGSSAGGGGAGSAGTGTGGSTSDAGATRDAAFGEVAGPVTTAGCAGKNYPLCLDFENGIDTTVWTGGNAAAIETTEVAHGTHAYHLYSDNKANPTAGVLTTAKLGTLKDQIWGRFYLHFKPGAPGGHGNLVAASDGIWANDNYNGNWYEIGWQFDGIMGVFHPATGGERPLRSKPYIVDQWYCIELFFDGTQKGSPRWWIDGAEAQYYTPNSTTNPTTPATVLIPQFKSITVGWKPYAGLGLMLPDQKTIIDTRVLNDAWLDDVAFDTQRIGCIQ
jgi:hypothetical protein